MLECSKSDGLESEIAMETPSDFSNKSSKRESWNTQGGLLLCIADIIKPVHYMLKPFLKQLQRLRLLLAVLFRILNFSPYADLIVSLRPFFVRLIGLGAGEEPVQEENDDVPKDWKDQWWKEQRTKGRRL
jgi:hypothetical protein